MANIAEILKNAPKGLKLYSPLWGDVELLKSWVGCMDFKNNSGAECSLDEYGRFSEEGECVLFPSSEHRDWKYWQEVLMPQCVGSVFVDNNEYQYCLVTNDKIWLIDKLRKSLTTWFTFSEFNFIQKLRFATAEETKQCFKELDRQGYKFEDGEVVKKEKEWSIFDAKDGDFVYDKTCGGIFIFKGFDKNRILSYASLITGELYKGPDDRYGIIEQSGFRPATEKENAYLLEKLNEEGYHWDLFTHHLLKKEETSEKKFTVEDFKPFDKVLVRDCSGQHWTINLFSHYVETSDYPYKGLSCGYAQCLPYNEETAHLLGTDEEYDGKYKTWEGELQ